MLLPQPWIFCVLLSLPPSALSSLNHRSTAHHLFSPANYIPRLPVSGLHELSRRSDDPIDEEDPCAIGEVRVLNGCEQSLGANNTIVSIMEQGSSDLEKRGDFPESLLQDAQMLSDATAAVILQIYGEGIAAGAALQNVAGIINKLGNGTRNAAPAILSPAALGSLSPSIASSSASVSSSQIGSPDVPVAQASTTPSLSLSSIAPSTGVIHLPSLAITPIAVAPSSSPTSSAPAIVTSTPAPASSDSASAPPATTETPSPTVAPTPAADAPSPGLLGNFVGGLLGLIPTVAVNLPGVAITAALPSVAVSVGVPNTPKPTSAPPATSVAAPPKTSPPAALTLPAPPSSTCISQYTDTSNGAVYGPGLGTFPMSPRPSSFVKRNGQTLTLDGNPYRIAGPNIYWLGLDENVIPNPSYPDRGRVREAFAIAVAMGANTVRAHTLGVSTGNHMSVWPSAGQTNEDALDAIDYAIWAARNYGIRLIIPLTDDYQYYHGGKFDFISWAGLSKSDPWAFYTSDAVISLYKQYIHVLLTHVNSYTGVALKDDPTILGWETGNELGAYMLSGGAPPGDWTNNIASYIKSLAPNHLILDGTDGLINSAGDVATTAFGVSNVDLVTDHFYPAENWLLSKDIGLMNGKDKSYFVGELDWTGQKGGDSLSSFYNILESMPGSGSMIWSVFGHAIAATTSSMYADAVSIFVLLVIDPPLTQNDGYSLEYPNGNTNYLQSQILLLIQHWARLTGKTVPTSMPAVACPQPDLLQ